MKAWILLIAALLVQGLKAQQSHGEIRGIILNDFNQEIVDEAVVKLLQGEKFVSGVISNIHGEFVFKFLHPGTYDIEVSRTGYQSSRIEKIKVRPGITETLDVRMAPLQGKTFEVVASSTYTEKILNPGAPAVMTTIDANELTLTAAGRTVQEAITAFVPRTIQTREGGPIHFSGSRAGATLYIVDGVKMIGDPHFPNQGIASVQVIMGGIPAQYGDTIGGVVIINTKSYFDQ